MKKILTCSVSRELIIIASLICLRLKHKFGLCSINCHIQWMNGNCSESLRVPADSLRVVSAMTEHQPLQAISEEQNSVKFSHYLFLVWKFSSIIATFFLSS